MTDTRRAIDLECVFILQVINEDDARSFAVKEGTVSVVGNLPPPDSETIPTDFWGELAILMEKSLHDSGVITPKLGERNREFAYLQVVSGPWVGFSLETPQFSRHSKRDGMVERARAAYLRNRREAPSQLAPTHEHQGRLN